MGLCAWWEADSYLSSFVMWDSLCKAVNEDHPERISFKDPLEDSDTRKCTHLIFCFQFQGGLIHSWASLESRLRML